VYITTTKTNPTHPRTDKETICLKKHNKVEERGKGGENRKRRMVLTPLAVALLSLR
jgi:hypothetical protein